MGPAAAKYKSGQPGLRLRWQEGQRRRIGDRRSRSRSPSEEETPRVGAAGDNARLTTICTTYTNIAARAACANLR